MSISLSRRLLKVVDSARVVRMRGVNRAQFVRDALAEKLARMGIPVPDEDVMAPDRAACVLNEEAAQAGEAPRAEVKRKINYRDELKKGAAKKRGGQ